MSNEEKRELSAEQVTYGQYVTSAINLTRGLQVSHLKWYWDMGNLVHQFLGAGNKLAGKTLDVFAADLKGHVTGVEFGTSTLYCARSIHLNYKLDALDDMVQRGVTVGHLKLLIPLKDDAKEQVTKKLYGPDGKAITIKQLDDLINGTAREVAQESVAKATEQVKLTKPTPPPAPSADQAMPVDQTPETPPVAEVAKPDDGKTGTRGATPQKEFSQPPLKALKTYDNAATKLIACTGDALIAVNEGIKVGFDSEKAQKNFREAFNSAMAATRDVMETARQLLAVMDEMGKDI